MPDQDLISPEQFAELAEVHLNTVYRWRKNGALPPPAQTRPLRWRKGDIERWLKSDPGQVIALDDKEWAEMQAENNTEWTPSINEQGKPAKVPVQHGRGRPLAEQTPSQLRAELSSLRNALGEARIKIRGKARPNGMYLQPYPPGEVKVVRGYDGGFMSIQGFAEIVPWEFDPKLAT